MEKTITVKSKSCKKCGYAWLPRVKTPLKCPKCGHRFDSSRINQKTREKEK